ncbi:MAG: hypothetical protein GTO02_04530, partial [Candidatus Dadabacteria bacterium]|nr:hypothetical protein [Candidatus Dadabacteria bacterium]NIQ13685.1 hypothetical protein [Candidatus Dadabacteria bacterium]
MCGNGCTYGCMHGVIAEAFGDEKYKKIIKSVNSLCGEISGNLIADNLEDVTKGMSEFCASGEMSNQYRKGNCAHAMGHALLGLSQYNLEKSIETCKSFDNKGMGYYCATGAFMEYVENLVRNKEYKKLEKDQTEHFPCDVYDDYPAACYRYMLSIIAHRKGVKLMDMVSECKKLDKRMRRGCFHALGLKFMRRIVKDPNLMKTVCLAGNEDDAIMCIEGVIERLVEIDEDQAFKLCSYLEGENKQICET